MRRVMLGELASFASGGTPSRKKPEFYTGEIPWVTGADIDVRGRVSARAFVTRDALAGSAANVVPAGTLLLVTRTSVGKVGVPLQDTAFSQDITAIHHDPTRVDRDYLMQFLRSQEHYFASRSRGATIKGVTREAVAHLPVPVPPLDEQRRIAAILDQADALRAKRRQALAHLDDLTRSLFLDMFGDPSVNPAGFVRRSLGSLATVFRDGPFGSNLKSSHYVDSGVRVIRLQNIGVGRFVDNGRAYVTPEHFASLKRHRCLPGDVLIATLGDPNLRACLQPEALEVALNKADCVQMRVDSTQAEAEWVCALINMPGTLRLATSLVLGQTRSRISMGRLRELKVPVPPLNIQREFCAHMGAINAQRAAMNAAFDAEDQLFASLQSGAFRGEL